VENNIQLKKEIEEKENARMQLMLSDKVFENATEAIVITDESNSIIRVNKAFSAITGYSAEEVIGKDPSFQQSGIHSRNFYKKMWEAIENDHWQGEIINRKKNGDLWPCWMTISRIRHGDTHYYVAVASDISAIRASQEEIEFLAYHDTLTSLPNRRLFKERVEHAVFRANRTGDTFALLYIDLDKFKYVNDTMGHHTGDVLLMEVTRRLKKTLRKEDTVSRFGGDEFLILLESTGKSRELEHLIRRILDQFRQPFALENREVTISASIGVSLYPGDAPDADTLIRHADLAMYEAKKKAQNSFAFYDRSLSTVLEERFDIEHDLRKALERNELSVHYQPQIGLRDMKPCGVEALLRWKHGSRGWIDPELFIPIAEETGIIHEIGLFALEECCRQAHSWDAEGMEPLRIALNVSAKQYADANLPSLFSRTVSYYGLDPSRFELEITESHMIENQISVIESMVKLREKGFTLAIDDFGTGYSSLGILKSLPIQRLKIDKSFIRDIMENEDDRTIALTILSMGKNLGLHIVAEGVENEGQLAFLQANGCHEIQGFLFAPAMSGEDFVRWYRSYSPRSAV